MVISFYFELGDLGMKYRFANFCADLIATMRLFLLILKLQLLFHLQLLTLKSKAESSSHFIQYSMRKMLFHIPMCKLHV